MVAESDDSRIPLVVVVCFVRPLDVRVPYGSADLLIIVPVLPESISAMRSLCMRVFCIDFAFRIIMGVRSPGPLSLVLLLSSLFAYDSSIEWPNGITFSCLGVPSGASLL